MEIRVPEAERRFPLFSAALITGALAWWAVLSFYGGALYFVTDDFIFLQRAATSGFLDTVSVHDGAGLFRPLTRGLYFKIMHPLFGMNPVPYHAVNMVLHGLNIALVIVAGKKLAKSLETGAWAGFMYAAALINFRLYAWISCIQDIAMIFFALLAFVCFMHSTASGGRGRWRMAAGAAGPLLFTLSLLSKESVVWLPVWLWVYDLIKRKGGESGLLLKRRLRAHAGYDAVLVLYLLFRLIFLPPPESGEYAMSLWGPHLLARADEYAGYVLMSIGLPGLERGQAPFPSLIIFGTLSAALAAAALRRPGQGREIVLGLSWFALGALIFLLLTERSYPYYISLASIGLFWTLGHALSAARRRFEWEAAAVAAVYLIIFCYSNVIRHHQSFQGHFIAEAARMNRNLHRAIKSAHPELPQGATVVIGGFNPGHSPDTLGIELLYENDIKVLYLQEAFHVREGLEMPELEPKPGYRFENAYVFMYTEDRELVEYRNGTWRRLHEAYRKEAEIRWRLKTGS